jgi:hypothetical protein
MAVAVSPFLQISRLVAGFPNIAERAGHALKGVPGSLRIWDLPSQIIILPSSGSSLGVEGIFSLQGSMGFPTLQLHIMNVVI